MAWSMQSKAALKSNYVYPIDVVYLDFQKAFDKVPHKRLMLNMKSLRFVSEIFNWIDDSEQRVLLSRSSSK